MAANGYTKLTRGELERAGYSPTSERYRAPSGEIVSRRQYDNARYTAAGWRNRADFERRHNDPTYSHFIRKIARAQGTTRRAIDTPTSRDAKLLLKARAVDYGKTRRGRGAKGPMAKVLVAAGMRDPNATYPVGGTP